MTRKLSPVTIIPPELYVDRAADRQLRDIIEGMGRPGYVLVARQMGKTNLLLNARRSLECENLHFVYVDLSMRLESLGQYYKLLLSTAENVHPAIFGETAYPIREEYTSVQFENAIRAVLKSYSGRLVIVLDEIDSLAHCSFSDQIFSQIRSMYFLRANYAEFNRITYILSGVAEPSDLIKDKNISPFNIGEKIYLGDFTVDEYRKFLKQADLKLPEVAAQSVYNWTAGNPRITWDVCSELEQLVDSGHEITSLVVDDVVKKMYLTSFDKAPVDHVRTIVQSDKDLRRALQSIHSGSYSDISDALRNRLYLAGIVSLANGITRGALLALKNPIIGEALSQKWLADLERDSKSLLQTAREHYEEGRFEASLSYYEQYLEQQDLDSKSVDAYRLARSYFHTHKFGKSIEWFERYLQKSEPTGEVLAQIHYMVGRAHQVLGDIAAAVNSLRAAAELRSPVQKVSMGILGAALLQLDIDKHSEEVEAQSLEAIRELESGAAPDARVAFLRNMATIKVHRGDRSGAISLFEEALAIGSRSYQPFLLVELLHILEDGQRKSALLDQLGPSVIELIRAPGDEQPDGSLEPIVLRALVALRRAGKSASFDELLSEFEATGVILASERYRTLEKLYSTAINETGQTDTSNLVFVRQLVDDYLENPNAQRYVLDALRILVIWGRSLSDILKYIDLRLSFSAAPIEETDFIATGVAGSGGMSANNIELLQKLEPLISMLRQEGASSRTSFGYCWLSCVDMDRQISLGRVDKATEAAKDVLSIVETLTGTPPSLVEQMKTRALRHLQSFGEKPRVINRFRHIGRNTWLTVKYRDNRVVRQKFKALQRDLVLGHCEIVSTD